MSTLIEKLEKTLKALQDAEKGRYTVGISDGYEQALNDVKQHRDWISVDERLPEPNKIVLVAIHYPQYYVPDFMYVTTADYDEVRNNKWSGMSSVKKLENVVYWMPFPQIPSPPKEV